MKHALRAALDLTVFAVLIAFCCQWATLGLRPQGSTPSLLAIFEATAAAPDDPAPAEPIRSEAAPEGTYVQLAGLND